MLYRKRTNDYDAANNEPKPSHKVEVNESITSQPNIGTKPLGIKASNNPFKSNAGSKPDFMKQVKEESQNVIQNVKNKPFFKAK